MSDGLTKDQRYYRSHKAENAARVKAWLKAHPGANSAACQRYYQKSSLSQRAKAKRRYESIVKPFKSTDAGRLKERIKWGNRRRAMNGKVTVEEWEQILVEHSHKCFYRGSTGPLEMDHVLAVTKGGKHEKNNIVPACKPCNASKGNRHATPPRLNGGR